jgi:hypothetical protein
LGAASHRAGAREFASNRQPAHRTQEKTIPRKRASAETDRSVSGIASRLRELSLGCATIANDLARENLDNEHSDPRLIHILEEIGIDLALKARQLEALIDVGNSES